MENLSASLVEMTLLTQRGLRQAQGECVRFWVLRSVTDVTVTQAHRSVQIRTGLVVRVAFGRHAGLLSGRGTLGGANDGHPGSPKEDPKGPLTESYITYFHDNLPLLCVAPGTISPRGPVLSEYQNVALPFLHGSCDSVECPSPRRFVPGDPPRSLRSLSLRVSHHLSPTDSVIRWPD